MKNKIKTLCGFFVTLATLCHAEIGDFQITFRAVDESGKPMRGVKLGASFIQSKSFAPITANDLSKKQIDDVTDTNGQAVISGSSVYDRHIDYGADKVQGYYRSGGGTYTFEK